MKIPRSVTIKGVRWKVKRIPKGKLFDDDGQSCLGLCDLDNKTILLENGQSDQAMLDSFVHEWLHAVASELHWVLPDEVEESMVLGLTSAILSTFEIKLKK